MILRFHRSQNFIKYTPKLHQTSATHHMQLEQTQKKVAPAPLANLAYAHENSIVKVAQSLLSLHI